MSTYFDNAFLRNSKRPNKAPRADYLNIFDILLLLTVTSGQTHDRLCEKLGKASISN